MKIWRFRARNPACARNKSSFTIGVHTLRKSMARVAKEFWGLVLIPLLSLSLLSASDSPTTNATDPNGECLSPAKIDQAVLPHQELCVQGKPLAYEVRAGALSVHGKNENDTADISFVAYFVTDNSEQNRPISFCFNGGPGSSSVWLHMGLLGPKIVDLNYPSQQQIHPNYVDNPNSLLAVSDLVFIDPVGTGFSKATKQTKETTFFGVEEDLYSIADFIQLFLTKYQRWSSPKFLIGESYGTLRASGLTKLLQEKHFIDMNGIVLISCVLDMQVLDDSLLAHILNLPTMAATAQYHKKLHSPLAELPVSELIEKAGNFAIKEYAPALLLGDSLPKEDQQRIITQLCDFTSLPSDFIAKHNLRISFPTFQRELLNGESIGFYDSRLTIPALPEETYSSLDHSFYIVSSAFASALESYLTKELHWNPTGNYVILNHECNNHWYFNVNRRPPPGCGYLSFIRDLRQTMLNNASLSLFVAGGYYDFATPFFSQCYSINQLLLPESRRNKITVKGYTGGHMMYLEKHSREALCKDIASFMNESAKSP